MHSHSIQHWQHSHAFIDERQGRNERRTWQVVGLTAAMMGVEIVAGTVFGSMALAADGWHMATHVAALGIAALAYRAARLRAHDARYTFGTGKFGELAAFASAILLLLVALSVGYESIVRLWAPSPVRFAEALPVAVAGLVVNLASAWLLGGHDHGHGHDHHHGHAHHDHADDHHDPAAHDHHGHDTNFRAAYVHVLADALTSVLAIGALLGGRYLQLNWLDPLMGIVGAVAIAVWALRLIRTASRTLLDTVPDPALAERIRERLEAKGDRVTDLHLWRLGPQHLGLIVALVSDDPQPPSAYRSQLADMGDLSHISVEVERCSA